MSEDRRHNREGEANRSLTELLSAYLDDRESLSSTEVEQVEVLLEQDEAARQSYAELQTITRELSSLPSIESPRSYHLNAEMVGAPEPIVLQETPAWYARHTAAVRWTTAAAAVLFAFVLGADLVINGVFSDPQSDSDLFQAEQAELSSRQGESDEDGSAAGGDDAEAEAVEEEAVEEEAADDSGGAAEPPGAALVPENAGDNEDAEAVEEDESAEPTAMLEFGVDEEQEAGDTSVVVPTEGLAMDESSAENQANLVDEDLADRDDGSPDRRAWRIAEFSLVILLGVLITLMVVLPRLGGGSARTGSG